MDKQSQESSPSVSDNLLVIIADAAFGTHEFGREIGGRSSAAEITNIGLVRGRAV